MYDIYIFKGDIYVYLFVFMQVGGIKEKVLVVYRAGIRRIIMSYRNEKDLFEIFNNIRVDKLLLVILIY